MKDVKKLIGMPSNSIYTSEFNDFLDKDCESIIFCADKEQYDNPSEFMIKFNYKKCIFILDDLKVILDAKVVNLLLN